MRTANFYDYLITEHGEVYGKRGNKRKPVFKNGRYDMRFTINNIEKTYPLARVIYAAFNKDFDITDKNECVTFKDNNKLNLHIDNLICKFRGDLIQGDNHRNRIKITNTQAKAIKKEYELTVNDRPVNQYNVEKTYNSYRKLAKKYNVTFPLIKQIVEGKTRNRNNYKLKK